MKILFAVSNENISNAIVKNYQKKYNDAVTFKNVFYFNAITKEIQKDKFYDCIVISEDLEPFANSNYDVIDKFILGKLESISFAVNNIEEKEIPIILICTDRRTKSGEIISKFFDMKIYNALIGSDRKIDEVCKLIANSRTKEEARRYYNLVDDEPQDLGMDDVSELEVQNILIHYKRLGGNEEKYVESFNNIASQYTDNQLRIIIRYLPIKVKAVLESECPKYQELVMNSAQIESDKEQKAKEKEKEKRLRDKYEQEQLLREKIEKEKRQKEGGLFGNRNKPQDKTSIDILDNKRNEPKMSSPVIIPGSIDTRNERKLFTDEEIAENENQNIRPVQKQNNIKDTNQVSEVPNIQNMRPVQQAQQVRRMEENASQVKPTQQIPEIKQMETVSQVKPTQQIPEIKQMETVSQVKPTQQIPEIKQMETVSQVKPTQQIPEIKQMKTVSQVKPAQQIPEVKQVETLSQAEAESLPLAGETVVKKGRGRPRKNPIPVEPKPKGKRGRPRKNPIPEQIQPDIESNVENKTLNTQENNNTILPGLDDFDDSSVNNNTFVNSNNQLPGLEDDDFSNVNVSQSNIDNTLPGFEDDEFDNVDVNQGNIDNTLPGFEDDEFDNVSTSQSNIDNTLPGFEDDEFDNVSIGQSNIDNTLPGFEDDEFDNVDVNQGNIDNTLPGFEEDSFNDINNNDISSGVLPGFEEMDDNDELNMIGNYNSGYENNNYNQINNTNPYSNTQKINEIKKIEENRVYSTGSLSTVLTSDKKIAAFVGTSKNGTSFLINNLACLFSSIGVNTAVLDMTKNKNSYYIFTDNNEELRKIAYNSFEKLENGVAEGIKVDRNLTIYTSVPNEEQDVSNSESILSTLVRNHTLVLIDCDFETDFGYFANSQEIYLVQSMDVLTIQPLTTFLRELKTRGILDPQKLRAVINKEVKVRGINSKTIIGGMSCYNDPAMSFMTELFNKDKIRACTIPFDPAVYSKYLETLITCKLTISGYSKNFINSLKILGNMIYPLMSKQTYGKANADYSRNNFSDEMNNTLNQMKNKY